MCGLASALLLFTHGRMLGISGITGGLVRPRVPDRHWRVAFVAGLAVSGLVAHMVAPSALGASVVPLPVVIAAGLLVGFGAQLGSGCTSGHALCGLARFSPRSAVAVLMFVVSGLLTVLVVRGVS